MRTNGASAPAHLTAADLISLDPAGSYDDERSTDNHLPDIGVLVVACCVGISTGCGVVLFNQLVHFVQNDLVWESAPRAAAFGAAGIARGPTYTTWRCLLLPPIVGGVAVAALRGLMGGFDGDPKSVQTRAPRSQAADSRSNALHAPPPLPPWYRSKHLRLSERAIEVLTKVRETLRPYVKLVAAAVTLGSGASLGPEGPSVELGKANASSLARLARVRGIDITTDLFAAGAGAGVAAGFGAPMSGVLFAVETVLLSSAARRAAAAEAVAAAAAEAKSPGSAKQNTDDDDGALLIATVLVGCVFASMVSLAGLGAEPAFIVPRYTELSLQEVPLCITLGLLCGVAASLLGSASRSTERAFVLLRDSGVPAAAMPLIGGLACGSLAVKCPEITYQGFDNVDALMQMSEIDHGYTVASLLIVVGTKIVATSTCRASGLVGGVYAPSIFIGAALGIVARMAADFVPGADVWLTQAPAYALVGAGAMLAAYCRVPLTSVLLLFELTMDYTIVVPTLATVGFARWSSARMDRLLLKKR